MATYQSKNQLWRFLVEELDYDLQRYLPQSWIKSSSQTGRVAGAYTAMVAAIAMIGAATYYFMPKSVTAPAGEVSITLANNTAGTGKPYTAPARADDAPVRAAVDPAAAPAQAAVPPVQAVQTTPPPAAAKKLIKMTMVIAEKGCKANGKRFDCVVQLIDENGQTAKVKDGWQRADLRLKDTKVGAKFGNVVAAINERPAGLTASQAAEYFQVAGFDLQIKYGKEFRYG